MDEDKLGPVSNYCEYQEMTWIDIDPIANCDVGKTMDDNKSFFLFPPLVVIFIGKKKESVIYLHGTIVTQ